MPKRPLSFLPILLHEGLPHRAHRALAAYAHAEGDRKLFTYGEVVVELTLAFGLTLDEIDALLGVELHEREYTCAGECLLMSS